MKPPLFTLALFALPLLAQENPTKTVLPAKSAAAVTTNAKSLLLIDPKGRSQDYAQAFDLLRKDRPTQKIMVQLSNGMVLSSVTEVTSSQNGTLLMIKYSSNSGNKYQIVPVEEISEIGYSPS